jgi:hypothetical protein
MAVCWWLCIVLREVIYRLCEAKAGLLGGRLPSCRFGANSVTNGSGFKAEYRADLLIESPTVLKPHIDI